MPVARYGAQRAEIFVNALIDEDGEDDDEDDHDTDVRRQLVQAHAELTRYRGLVIHLVIALDQDIRP